MTDLLKIAIAVLVAASASYFGNRLLFQQHGRNAAFWSVPAWEELCKLGAALILPGTPFLLIHLLFGLLECSYDLLQPRRRALAMGMLSLLTHSLTGLSVVAADRLGLGVVVLWVVAVLVHVLMNYLSLHVVVPRLRSLKRMQG